LPVSTASGRAAAPIHLRAKAGAIAITPDGKTLYVTNPDDDTVTPINTGTNAVGQPIHVRGEAEAIVITP
jgi:YVTN family beta-propeller protein